jgi:choline dehydrogenase
LNPADLPLSEAEPFPAKLELVTVAGLGAPGLPRGRVPMKPTNGVTMGNRQVDEADYVVVGSGSAGSAVAGRLAQSGASVILLEAGKTDKKFLTRKPGMIGPMHAEPKIKRLVDWGYYSVPQSHILDRKMPVPRGKVVGGSSSVNGMVYVRGNRANYDSWAAEGNTGWDADSVNAAYKRLEDFEDGENAYRGGAGPIKISRNKTPQEGTLQFIQATSDALGVKVLDDYNAAEQEGIARMQQNAADGIRYSASRGYVHDLNPPSLHLEMGVLVTRVVIENGRATGVEVRDAKGNQRVIRAGREVILSAGFVGTPQILMLSGVGHADHLGQLGIDVRADLPVGDNLHDHMFHALTFHATSSTLRGTPWFFAKGVLREITRGNSFLANSVFESVGFVRTSQAADVPDLQLHLLPWAYVSPNQDEPIRHDVDKRTALTVLTTLIYPRSRGTLRLASTDPAAAPLIDFNYLAEPGDLEVLAEGSEMVREIFAGAAFGGSVKEEIHPGAAVQGRELRKEILNRATSVYHGVGTCRMGVDDRAVVTPDLKVKGIEGLRVADASIMPSITGGNTNAPSIMIGEKAAALILQGA